MQKSQKFAMKCTRKITGKNSEKWTIAEKTSVLRERTYTIKKVGSNSLFIFYLCFICWFNMSLKCGVNELPEIYCWSCVQSCHPLCLCFYEKCTLCNQSATVWFPDSKASFFSLQFKNTNRNLEYWPYHSRWRLSKTAETYANKYFEMSITA